MNRLSMVEQEWTLCWFLLEPSDRWSKLDPLSCSVNATPYGSLIRNTIDSLFLSESLPQTNALPLQEPLVEMLYQQIMMTLANDTAQSLGQVRLANLYKEVVQQLHLPWDVAALARRVNWSEAHLHRLCQRYYQVSPKRYLLKLRMERACQMLETSAWPITDIAAVVGYSNVANFSSRFHKEVGVSPRAYRQAS
jgi:AraC-like DNA-binding protein